MKKEYYLIVENTHLKGRRSEVFFKMIPFSLIEQKKVTNNLVIVLPGAGYTTQAPLLRFTTGVFYNKGFDVLHINYTFNRQELSELSEEVFARDVQLVIRNAIKSKKYSNYYIVAKSIGTIALSHLLNDTMFKDAKVVWLTPLLQRDVVFNAMVNSDHKGLCIIGDEDSCFIAERFERLKDNPNLICKIVDGGNHSLELDVDPIKSIDILKSVIVDISEF
ncbi:alpha/beta hydrolase [Robertmurraya korlensis]|uniref:alpha/beta hydrolase n=1 Tax=Robertmurraya korlensis TaxID=519977 RepID=UPI002040EC78|nr:alpha/beta hydrolase [Robertmurraya korlensis]MCM3602746.1 alpha/beta hydrolase [Robertmurraya korlensis]